MVSTFYKKYAKRILGCVLVSLPILVIQAESLPSNNDIETWLPRQSPVRQRYEDFKDEFGAEELILIGVERDAVEQPLVESLCERIERLPGIRTCWSPNRFADVMRELDVPNEEIRQRLKRFAVSEDGELAGLVALLSAQGLADRAGTVDAVRAEIAYCQLDGDEVSLAGAPVVVAELDRLGSRDSNKKFFIVTLLISLGLLYYTIRQWKLALAILGLTVWAINLTLATLKLAGGEMNFIMGALSVMVMVFTLAICIHVLHYYRRAASTADPLGGALALAWKPCCLATVTTTIGLLSLTVSDIGPVQQFGYAASIGSVAALVTGLGLTPAVLVLCPDCRPPATEAGGRLKALAHWMLDHSRAVALTTGAVVAVTCLGLLKLESKIDPLDFLPRNAKVLADIQRVERELSGTSSIEAVVDFSDQETAFVKKLDAVRRLENAIADHPTVQQTMSLATFFPEQLPADPMQTASLLGRAGSLHGDENDFVADDGRLWRISARIPSDSSVSRQKTLRDLAAGTDDAPAEVTFTGIAPLLERAQHEIFDGFWKSFTMAFGIITLVMMVSLRSIRAALVVMVPNLTPIAIVFGALGWYGFPVDIGMMMTASIALGIAVDGTFHFMVCYEDHYGRSGDSAASSRTALLQTGAPIFKAAMIAGIGMLALTMSNFTPTARFGYMMATLLGAALIGDLVLLPALLSQRPGAKRPAERPAIPQPAHHRIGRARRERARHVA